MPHVGKQALSRHLRSGCDRQLALLLVDDDERAIAGMPFEQKERPGLGRVMAAGRNWEDAKTDELIDAFGTGRVVSRRNGKHFDAIDLRAALERASSSVSAKQGMWLVQPEYEVTPVFLTALKIQDLTEADFGSGVRPDLVEMCPIGTPGASIRPDGSLLLRKAADDQRIPLRVIDIKLTEDPGAAYFAEVTYYSMLLAAWLEHHSLNDRYVVIDQGAVWPGSWDKSAISQAGKRGYLDLRAVLEQDVETAPFAALVPSVQQFFLERLPRAISTPWPELAYHVSSACSSCPFIGTSWGKRRPGQAPKTHPLHCVNVAAATGHLSQVADVTRGARVALERHGVHSVADLAVKPDTDGVFDEHHVLKGRRSVLAKRAEVLHTHGPAQLARKTGASVEMPSWADLHIHATAHFDLTSAITLAMGISAFAPQLRAKADAKRLPPRFEAQVFYTDEKSVDDEWEKCLKPFLEAIDALTKWAMKVDPKATMQLYLWDELERKHIMRIVGRHLNRIIAQEELLDVVWKLFPSEEILPDPDAVHPSPITIVRNVVQSRIAADVPHHYTLLSVAREIADRGRVFNPSAAFRVPDLCHDPLTDQIPSERAHDIWARPVIPNRGRVVGDVQQTIATRLWALSEVRRSMFDRLNPHGLLVTKGPRINRRRPSVGNATLSSQLWFLHARLNAALTELETAQIRAMPSHEREAKHHSVRLEPELRGKERADALAKLFPSGPVSGVRVFPIRDGSKEAKVRPGDFLFSLTPELDQIFLERKVGTVCRDAGVQEPASLAPSFLSRPMREALSATVLAFDRDSKLIAIELDSFWARVSGWPSFLNDLEHAGVLDFTRSWVLDPISRDFLTGKLRDVLQDLGAPPEARAAEQRAPGLQLAVGRKRGRTANPSSLPGVGLLWNAPRMHAAQTGRATARAESYLRERLSLNESQWSAWREAMNRRLSIIWGPPGTGKTHTLKAVIAGLALDAHEADKPLRIAVGATTYKAIHEVLNGLATQLPELIPGIELTVRGARSGTSDPAPEAADYAACVIDRDEPQPAIDLFAELTKSARHGIQIVGIPSQQVFNLIKHGGEPNGHPAEARHAELFDVMILDEASQIDVANAALFAAGMAKGASVIVAGDQLQLPPIHAAEPPAGLEAWVGPLINYLTEVHGVQQETLLTNYRSNRTIVELGHVGDYPLELHAHSPDLELRLAPPTPPAQWPQHLPWTLEWDALLDPSIPVSCVVYDDTQSSSQWNHFEAQAVAALVTRLRQRLHRGLANELDYDDELKALPSPEPWSDREFFEKAVGVVTPHRAQLALISSLLEADLAQLTATGPPLQRAWVRGAIDTVERFQGQERDVIIVSYALGDVDAIADEEEFLLSLNRFNVAASRARAKLIVLASAQVIHHLPSEIDVLRSSTLLKVFATSYCNRQRPLTLPGPIRDETATPPMNATLRWRQS